MTFVFLLQVHNPESPVSAPHQRLGANCSSMALCNEEKWFELHVKKQESLCPSQQHGWQLTENWRVWTLTHWTLNESCIDSQSFLLYNYLFFLASVEERWMKMKSRERERWLILICREAEGETLFPLTNGELRVLCVMYGSYLVLDNNFVMEWSLQSHAPRLNSLSGWSWKSLSILIPDTKKESKRKKKRKKANEAQREQGRHVNNQPVSDTRFWKTNSSHFESLQSTFWPHFLWFTIHYKWIHDSFYHIQMFVEMLNVAPATFYSFYC